LLSSYHSLMMNESFIALESTISRN
jgi:hypothetical protein